MKNICFFTGDTSRAGGTERCVSLVANEMVRRTQNTIIIADLLNEKQMCFFDIDNKIKVIHLQSKSVFDGIKKLHKICLKYEIDIIINVEAMLGVYSIPATMFKKTQNIIWEHGNFFQKQCRTIDFVRWLEIKLCKNYITLTNRDKENFENHFKGRCAIEYIYNPIDLPSEDIEYNVNSKTILTVGLMRHIKGFDMLADVANAVLKRHQDWTWEIYGYFDEQDEYVKQVFNKVKEYGIEDRLLFKGITKDITEKYRAASLMVMTSRMEGLPMTLLEAKSYKLPIVSFDIETGPSEIIQDEVNGYLVKPYDTDEMSEKICKLIEDAELRQHFSDNAYADIEKFDIYEIIKKWIGLIGE